MTQVHQIATLLPLAVAASAVACTITIRALAVIATVNFVRRERRLGRVGAGFLIDLSIVALAISIAPKAVNGEVTRYDLAVTCHKNLV